MMYTTIFPVEKMCRVLKVSSSGYYYWKKNPISKQKQRRDKLLSLIKSIYLKSKSTYGAPRITKELHIMGEPVSQKTVAKIMRENNIRSIVKRKFKVTTDSKHSYSISPNLLQQKFIVGKQARVWVSDITYINTRNGWIYLTVIIDLFDRKVIGWSMSETMSTNQTIIPAWKMAVRNKNIEFNLIFHSDRGVQYASKRFRKMLKAYPLVKQSMSRKRNCWDNAVAESFFKSMKVEAIYPLNLLNREDMKLSVFEYIESWYNQNRRHSHLGNLTIKEFEYFNQLKQVA